MRKGPPRWRALIILFFFDFCIFCKIGVIITISRVGASQIICTAIHGDLAARTLHIAVAVGRLDHITAMIAADCITNNFPHGYSSLGEYEKILNPKIEDCGGAYWTRTSDPIDVNDVLYQLSQSTMGFRYLFRACFHNANRKALCTSASMFYQLSQQTTS